MKVKGIHVAVLKVKHPRYLYKVSYRQGGKLRGKWFLAREKKAAETWAEQKRTELLNEGNREAPTSPAEREAILLARRELGAFDGATLERAIRFYADHLGRNAKRGTVAQLCELRIARAEAGGLSIRHLQDLRSRLGSFVSVFGEREIGTVTTEELDRWMDSRASDPQTHTNFRRVVSSVFEFAIKQGYGTANPVANTLRKKIVDKEKGILTPEQIESLLAACTPEMLPAVAIMALAGTRPKEVRRLTWDSLKGDYIHVGASRAKMARNRDTPITANLAAFLEPYRGQSGLIAPVNFDVKLRRIRKAAGITVWPPDCLRHSFASYTYAASKKADEVAADLGHSGTYLLFKHYRTRVPKSEGLKFLAIKPTSPENVVPITGRKLA